MRPELWSAAESVALVVGGVASTAIGFSRLHRSHRSVPMQQENHALPNRRNLKNVLRPPELEDPPKPTLAQWLRIVR